MGEQMTNGDVDIGMLGVYRWRIEISGEGGCVVEGALIGKLSSQERDTGLADGRDAKGRLLIDRQFSSDVSEPSVNIQADRTMAAGHNTQPRELMIVRNVHQCGRLRRNRRRQRKGQKWQYQIMKRCAHGRKLPQV